MEISGKMMEKFLSNIALGDIIKECVLHSSDQGMTCIALDITSQVYSHINCAVGLGEFTVGIGNLPMLLNYFKGAGDSMVSIKKADNRLNCMTVGTKASFRYLTSLPETIPTVPLDVKMGGEDYAWVQTFPHKLKVPASTIETYLKTANIVKPNVTKFSLTPRGRCLAVGGTKNETQFDVLFGDAEFTATENHPEPVAYEQWFATNILTKVFQAVLGTSSEIQISFCADKDDQDRSVGAVCVSQDTNIWIITPMAYLGVE